MTRIAADFLCFLLFEENAFFCSVILPRLRAGRRLAVESPPVFICFG